MLVFIVACQSVETPPKPKPLLEQSKMVELISDLVILDATMSVNSKTLEDVKVIPSKFIFQKYKLDSAQIAANLRYYNQDITQNKELYLQVKTRVEYLKNNYDSIKTLKDSLRRIEIEGRRNKKEASKLESKLDSLNE
jgi:hypothetical protein